MDAGAHAVTVQRLLAEGCRELRAAGVPDAQFDAAWLLTRATGLTRSALHVEPGRAVPPDQVQCFRQLISRRAGREPLQYILGNQPFLGLEMEVGPVVLVPRPETELLAETVVGHLRRRPAVHPVLVADVGTGSGCIAVALAAMVPEVRVWAVDISEAALAVAARNARRHGVQRRISFCHGDLLAPLLAAGLAGHLAALVANPPYVAAAEVPHLMSEVRDHEPHLALTPGPDALSLLRRLVQGAPALLGPGGLLALEVGIGQAQAVTALAEAAGFRQVAVAADYAGVGRIVTGVMPDQRLAQEKPIAAQNL